MPGTVGRAREALRSPDFRWLLASRLSSQFADGLFQAYLVAQLVFLNPDKQGTAAGVAKAYALLVIPFSVVGPLAGVFIDRWSRRRILAITPLVKAAAAAALFAWTGSDPMLYAGALVIVSLNRFFLSTATAVMPLLVAEQNLLVGNSLATVGGTIASFVGIVAGTKLVDAFGARELLFVVLVLWPVGAVFAASLSGALRPRGTLESLRHHLGRVFGELGRGARRLGETPAAAGSVVSVSVEQFLVGLVTVLSLVVLKEHLGEGVGSFGNIVAAGGVGVFAGTATVGWLEDRLPKVRIIMLAFVLAGTSCLVVAPEITGPTILFASFALGLTFSWKKIPVDTIVQEGIPDRYRGRAFAVYDIVYASSRVVAAAVAIPLTDHLSAGWILAACGLVFIAWTPVVPWWLGRPQRVGVRFYAGGRADESLRGVVVAGEEERVDVLGSSLEERGGRRFRRFHVRGPDENTFDVVGDVASDRWHVEGLAPSPFKT